MEAGISTMRFRIYEHIINVSEPNNGWTKELNLVSWHDREPVYDIRTWNADHSKYGKGVTLTAGELMTLKNALMTKQVF